MVGECILEVEESICESDLRSWCRRVVIAIRHSRILIITLAKLKAARSDWIMPPDS